MVVTNISLLRARHNVDHDGFDIVKLGQLYDALTESPRSSFMFAQSITPEITPMSDAEYSYMESEMSIARNFSRSNRHGIKLLGDINKYGIKLLGGNMFVKHKDAYESKTGTISRTARYTKVLYCNSLPHNLPVNENLPRSG